MKIEVGKKYKTRNGNTFVVYSVSRQGKDGRTIVGESIRGFSTWYPDGKHAQDRLDSIWDLVSEVKEKLKVTFCMDMPEDFKGLTADEIETELRNVFMGSEKKIRICREPNLGWCKGFVCDDIIVSGMTEE